MNNKLRNKIVISGTDNLNLVNFLEIATIVYPMAIGHFCHYLKSYKTEKFKIMSLNFSAVDNWSVIGMETIGGVFELDFWDIPFEMQFGIILNFFGTAGWPNADIKVDFGRMIAKEYWIDFICDLLQGYEETQQHRS